VLESTGRHSERRETTTMDFWYERAIRELLDIDDEATELQREAEEASWTAALEYADEDESEHGSADHEPDRALR
jgi:hypothetical protein